MKLKYIALFITAFSASIAMAEPGKFEGAYHSDQDINKKIIIKKTGDKKYFIENSAEQWEAHAYMGLAHTKDGKPYDYYKGVISWSKPDKKEQQVGYISMLFRKEGDSVLAIHRWNFWEDAKNDTKAWQETWIKEN